MVLLLGCVVGLLSGALGIGGGIVMAPLLLYVPPLFGLEVLDMKSVSGLTMVLSAATGLTGMAVHGRSSHVHTRLAVVMGSVLAAASFAAALGSAAVPAQALLAVFTAVAFASGILMLLPNARADRDVPSSATAVNMPLACGIAAGIGSVGGLIGQAGAFLLNPALIVVLRVSTRVAVGTSLAVISCAGIAGTLGKALAGQIALEPALALCAGASIGAFAGARLSGRLPGRAIRLSLGALILGAALRMTADLLAG